MVYQLVHMVIRQVLTWVLTEFFLALFAPPAPQVV